MAERPDADSAGGGMAGGGLPDPRSDATAAAVRRQSRDLLRRIADTLGVPVESLYRAAAPGAPSDEGAELLRLWAGIEDPAARRAVLDAARAAAGCKPTP